MTEKEIFLNMLKRVSGEEAGDIYFYWTEGNNVIISNEQDDITTFEFNDKGELVWYR